jgi:tetratricopeptide (TPR) repeat protein
MLHVRRLLTGLAGLSPLAALAETPAQSASGGDISTLDPVFVEASTQTPWHHLSVPGFEILSHCPDPFNRVFAHALREATAARLALLPASFWGSIPTPMKIVLYDREPARKEAYVPGNPIDLGWASENGAVLGSGSVQLSHPVTVGDGDTFISCGNYWALKSTTRDLSVDADGEILIANRVPQLPAWFVSGVEGPCGVYVNRLIRSDSSGGFILLPNALWSSTTETIAIQNESRERKKNGQSVHSQTLLPLGAIFGGHFRAGQEGLWNAESSLLVRWGLFKSRDRKAFLDFVDQAALEPITEPLFRRYLGVGYADVERQLREYLPQAVMEPVRVPFAEALEPELEIRDATSTEVARIIGDWGRLEGKSAGLQYIEYRSECMDQADKLFERALGRRNRNPSFLAAFGLYEIEVGDDVRAREALEAATMAGVGRPRAYVELARLRLEAALPSVQTGIGDLSDAEFDGILTLLRTAREQMPSLLPGYNVLAKAFEHAPARPARADLGALDEALRLFPRNAALVYKVATLYRTFGYGDEANSIVERALEFAETDEARALLASWHSRPRKG